MSIITTDNRSFRYGDGLFETLRIRQHQILWWQYHQQRIQHGLACLHYTQPSHFSMPTLHDAIVAAARQHDTPHVRARVTFYRLAGGLYTPMQSEFAYHINTTPLHTDALPDLADGLHVGICPTVRLAMDIVANCKTTSALRYVLAAQYAQQQHWNDAILLNTNDQLAEATSSNLWLIRDGIAYTPPLEAGCVRGVLRAFILETLRRKNFPIVEQPLTIQALAQADEIGLSNVVSGLRWVRSVADVPQRQYGKHLLTQINLMLNHELKFGLSH